MPSFGGHREYTPIFALYSVTIDESPSGIVQVPVVIYRLLLLLLLLLRESDLHRVALRRSACALTPDCLLRVDGCAIGGMAAGICIIVVLLALFVWYRRRQKLLAILPPDAVLSAGAAVYHGNGSVGGSSTYLSPHPTSTITRCSNVSPAISLSTGYDSSSQIDLTLPRSSYQPGLRSSVRNGDSSRSAFEVRERDRRLRDSGPIVFASGDPPPPSYHEATSPLTPVRRFVP